METRSHYPEGIVDEMNEKGSLNETQKHEIERDAANLLADWSKKLDQTPILDEGAFINSDIELISLIKQQIQKIDNNPEKNELYASFFLKMLSRGIDQMKFDGRATKNTKAYIEEAKADHYIPFMEEELYRLDKAA